MNFNLSSRVLNQSVGKCVDAIETSTQLNSLLFNTNSNSDSTLTQMRMKLIHILIPILRNTWTKLLSYKKQVKFNTGEESYLYPLCEKILGRLAKSLIFVRPHI